MKNTTQNTTRLELTRLTRALASCSLLSLVPSLALPQALPTGLNVTAGSAQVNTQGSAMTVTNTAGAVLNWQTFSIGNGASVRFEQPSATSQVLNRVLGNDPSSLFGTLTSNGRVWLLNPNGVIFGPNSRVDVAGLVTSTLRLNDADWLAGRYTFTGDAGSNATIVNQGELRTSFGGRVALIGSSVTNQGLIEAPGGQLLLAAGSSVELVDTGAPNLGVKVSAGNGEALNLGTLRAAGGRIDIHAAAVNQSGIVRADSLSGSGGSVELRASGRTTLADGSVTSASSSDGNGGSVALLGSEVGLFGSARAEASGSVGGGEVLVGGGWQGKDTRYPNARAVYMAPEASIGADALTSGNGGTVVLWGNEATRAFGAISATGGAQGGDGGRIETSGGWLDARPALINVSAANGKSGDWLLDPFNIFISVEAGNSGTTASFTANANNAQINSSTLQAALNAGTNVTVSTGGPGNGSQAGNILMQQANISVTAAAPGSLTVHADGSLTIENTSINTSGGAMPVTLRADAANSITMTSSAINAGAGAINVRTPSLTMSGSTLTSTAAGDAIVIAGLNNTGIGHFESSGVATPLVTSAGRWIAYLGSGINSFNVGSFNHNFRRVGAAFGAWAGDSGNGLVFSASSALQLQSGTASNKVYDATTAATFSGVTATTSLPGATVTLKNGVTASFLDKNVGTGKPVVFNGPEPFNVIDSQGKPVFGYIVPNLLANITRRDLALTGITANNRTYTGNLIVTVTGTPTVAPLGTDVVTLSSGISYDLGTNQNNKNVGTNKPVFIRGASISGADAGNYNLTLPSLTINVTQAPATLIGLTAANKAYDGSNTATFTGTAAVDLGLDVFELVNVVGQSTATATFSDKNAGNNKTVTVSGLTLSGSTAGNYFLVSNTLRANITPLALPVTGLSATNRTYNGTLIAPLTGTPIVTTPVVGDVVSVVATGFSGAFADKNVGTGKAVTVSGLTLTGTDAGNYTATPPTGLTANVTQRPANVTGLTGATKVYNGTPTITLGGSAALDVIQGDNVALSGNLIGTFTDGKNVGTNKPIALSGLSLTGTDAGNYSLVSPTGLTGSITQRPITVSGLSVANKTYDTTTSATLITSGATLVDTAAGDSVSLAPGASASFVDKTAGTGKAVTLSGLNLAGTDAPNYSLTAPSGLSANIARATATVTGLGAANKVYDGLTTATLTGTGALSGVLGSDVVTLPTSGLTGNFVDKHVGSNKTVNLTGLSLAGADAGNYNVSAGNTITASITQRPLTVSGLTATPRTYAPGNLTVAIGGAGTLNAIAGDNVSLTGTATGTMADANAGSAKPVTLGLGTLSITGTDATNYAFGLSSLPTGLTVSIAQADLFYVATPQSITAGSAIGTLGGTLSSFLGNDTQANSTTGTLVFTTTATVASPPGSYAINGGGLMSTNYRLLQKPENSTALTITAATAPTPPAPATEVVKVLQSIVLPTPATSSSTSGMADLSASDTTTTTAAAGPVARKEDFGTVRLSSLSPDAIQQLLASRDRYKKAAFAESISRLTVNPALADIRQCTTLREAQEGTCLVTDALQRQWAEQKRERAAVDAAPMPAPTPAPAAPPAAAAPPAPGAVAAAPAARPTPAPVASERRRVRQAALPQIERKVALVIGVDTYADAAIPPLANSVKDARAMARTFENELGYETIVLENASRSAVVAALNRLALDTTVLDSVVIYYAGHGELVEATKLGYWQLADADAKKPETWLSNTDIGRLVSRIPASQVALISDSCYSGSLVNEERIRASTSAVDPIAVLTRKTVVVMSSGGNEPVFDAGKNGHSPFAWSLMNSLQQVNNWRPGGQIFERVRFAVARELPQRPQYGASSAAGHQAGGDYLFEQRQLESR